MAGPAQMTVTLGELPAQELNVSASLIVQGAIASRDWAPHHHDHARALASGLPAVIMNTPTQLGLLNRYLSECLGWQARVLRLRCRMQRPLAAGRTILIRGTVRAIEDRTELGRCVSLEMVLESEQQVLTRCQAVVAIPCPGRERELWQADLADWTATGTSNEQAGN